MCSPILVENPVEDFLSSSMDGLLPSAHSQRSEVIVAVYTDSMI